MYYGKSRFTRKQLVFSVEVILCGALDTVLERCAHNFSEYEASEETPTFPDGVAYQTGMSLAILAAQLLNDGVGCGDALGSAHDFDQLLEKLFEKSWEKQKKVRKREQKLGQNGKTYTLADLYGKHYPDCHQIAVDYVNDVLGDYIDGDGEKDEDLPEDVEVLSEPKYIYAQILFLGAGYVLFHGEVEQTDGVGLRNQRINEDYILRAAVAIGGLTETQVEDTIKIFMLKKEEFERLMFPGN